MKGSSCVRFLQWALPRMGMRWRGFRKVRRQVCRKLQRRVAELDLSGMEAYRRYLEENPGEWPVLDGMCRITISRFCRDRRVFEALGGTVLPSLAHAPNSDGALRVWSAGCASGEEPYTISILWERTLARRFPGLGLQIVATDVGDTMLQRARTARYEAGTLKELPRAWVEEAFELTTDDSGVENFVLEPRYRRRVVFIREDIRERMPPGPFHLVLCRNLLFTYFDEEVQVRLLHKILGRMAPGGYLVLGSHEGLPRGEWPLERIPESRCVFAARKES